MPGERIFMPIQGDHLQLIILPATCATPTQFINSEYYDRETDTIIEGQFCHFVVRVLGRDASTTRWVEGALQTMKERLLAQQQEALDFVHLRHRCGAIVAKYGTSDPELVENITHAPCLTADKATFFLQENCLSQASEQYVDQVSGLYFPHAFDEAEAVD